MFSFCTCFDKLFQYDVLIPVIEMSFVCKHTARTFTTTNLESRQAVSEERIEGYLKR